MLNLNKIWKLKKFWWVDPKIKAKIFKTDLYHSQFEFVIPQDFVKLGFNVTFVSLQYPNFMQGIWKN